MNELNLLLEQEIKLNKKEPWNKLDKTIKLKKLTEYSLNYCRRNNIVDESRIDMLNELLKSKLNQKRLNTNKDVFYDVDKSIITSIPNLHEVNGAFCLKRNEGRSSTVKCLTPTKKN